METRLAKVQVGESKQEPTNLICLAARRAKLTKSCSNTSQRLYATGGGRTSGYTMRYNRFVSRLTVQAEITMKLRPTGCYFHCTTSELGHVIYANVKPPSMIVPSVPCSSG